ncbi:chromatin assembly factor 1 subunit A-domain-containing protein [Cercophora newfieldiana]|uniref:Chromatin assembly factor 1 subunit A-domain-containing protein n=1 Tax=Cercophora newfieldiana TaxID=92897 RepID=A0AA39YFH8_9PEZI|nr:chromatin assembly factor 1 subunit A-domain-containing protein [Cercophora newfieldiana]
MPLDEITNSQLNSQELESASRKRPLEELNTQPNNNETLCLHPGRGAGSPAKSSPGLTASGSSPLEGNSPSPNATPKRSASEISTDNTKSTKLTTSEPAAKRKRTKVSPEDKAAKAAADELKKKEKEALKAEKESIKVKEAAKKAEEAANKRREKEEAKAKKDAEKEEAKAKKSGLVAGQKRLTDMFAAAKGPSTPKKSSLPATVNNIENGSPAGTFESPARENDAYKKLFHPFFVKTDVTMASYPYEMDEATRETKSKILDDYLGGHRQHDVTSLSTMPDNEFLDFLQIPCRRRRGRVYPSVRKIMAGYHGEAASTVIDLTSESQRSRQISHTLEALKAVPMKSLKFREDVRPPYIGTISGLPPGLNSLKSIARRPTTKITTLNYDYDSEAEWQEEDGEDVEDLDDDEEDADVDEEMEDFLDDSEDVGPARLVFSGGMEPESTGLCWESRKRLNSPAKLFKFRMEFILETLPHHHSIDPFSSSYWEPEPIKAETAKPQSTSATSTSPRAKPTDSANKPANARLALGQTGSTTTRKVSNTKKAAKPSGPLPPDLHSKLKEFMRKHSAISKVGLIEFFAAENPGCTRPAVKASFELLTGGEKARPGRGKKWQLIDDA